MNWKDIFKPTKVKIIIALIILVISTISFYFSLIFMTIAEEFLLLVKVNYMISYFLSFPAILLFFLVAPINRGMSDLKYLFLFFVFVQAIWSYFLAVLLVWIYSKIRKK